MKSENEACTIETIQVGIKKEFKTITSLKEWHKRFTKKDYLCLFDFIDEDTNLPIGKDVWMSSLMSVDDSISGGNPGSWQDNIDYDHLWMFLKNEGKVTVQVICYFAAAAFPDPDLQ